ncbi:Brefeldin A-inhibited guanine nucleotide-exchange protein 2 (Brefeldin A-inhibited GEP 2) (ADP-ribosylation factor guanine nucleotide-exchange factor 2) [Durusdinium trenchii]|uniref:Signal recognition particle subunit SRP68 n=1 Tax=Durusdinium trenchii TaxID=1381693 RepID=A0ABP0NVM6_9DINO
MFGVTFPTFIYRPSCEALSPGSATRSNASIAGHQVVKRRAHGLGVSALVAIGQDDRQVELVNSESVASQIDAAQIELLFNKSTQLTPQAVVHFVTQLAKVSKEELALADQPRIFSLQKLVEVADFNMSRMRVVWTKIWRVLSSHFVEVATHPNVRVSHYAMDSLRQLTMKFLEKDELAGYNFQAEFLKPFECIMVGPPPVSREVKDYLVYIISYMADASFQNIRSGWKAVLHICAAAAQDPALSEATIEIAFKVVEKVNADSCYHLFLENFTDGIRALLSFAQCKVEKRPGKEAGVPDGSPFCEGSQYLLATLAAMRHAELPIVRAAALNGVFDILRDYGKQIFDEDMWRMVFNGVIKPLFDDIHHQLAPQSDHKQDRLPTGRQDGHWASMGPPTCLAALTQLVRLIEANLDVLAFLLDDVLRLIRNCIQHEFEAVARIGVEGFKQLLICTGKNMKPNSWQKVTTCILELFRDSMPTKLMEVDVKAASISADARPESAETLKDKEVVVKGLKDLPPKLFEQRTSKICRLFLEVRALVRDVLLEQAFLSFLILRWLLDFSNAAPTGFQYRQYCSRRLRRLYFALRFKHGKNRFKQASFPENFDDPKWIFIPLVQTERAWAFGVQLKADNAAAAAFNARWRHHSERKFAKACQYAQHLESVCKVHCDQRTQLEAEAYAAFMAGTWLVEREHWAEAKTKLARCKKLCEHFILAADQAEASALRTHLQELAPMLRECRYNLGEAEEEDEGLSKVTQSGKSTKDTDGGMTYRGHAVSIPSEKIKAKVKICLESAKAVQADADSENRGPASTEKYGEISIEFGEVLKDIHGEIIAAGADADTAEWRTAEAFIREASLCLSVERNLMLLKSHLTKLDDTEDVNTIDSRRYCRPEEGMRFCELIKEDLAALAQLPESSPDLLFWLSPLEKAVLDYRCMYLALCHTALGKLLEASQVHLIAGNKENKLCGKPA